MHVRIEIQSKEDADQGHQVFKEIVPDDVVVQSAQLLALGILEKGMESGKTSTMLLVKAKDQYFVVQASAALFETLAAGVSGAKVRFGDT